MRLQNATKARQSIVVLYSLRGGPDVSVCEAYVITETSGCCSCQKQGISARRSSDTKRIVAGQRPHVLEAKGLGTQALWNTDGASMSLRC